MKLSITSLIPLSAALFASAEFTAAGRNLKPKTKSTSGGLRTSKTKDSSTSTEAQFQSFQVEINERWAEFDSAELTTTSNVDGGMRNILFHYGVTPYFDGDSSWYSGLSLDTDYFVPFVSDQLENGNSTEICLQAVELSNWLDTKVAYKVAFPELLYPCLHDAADVYREAGTGLCESACFSDTLSLEDKLKQPCFNALMYTIYYAQYGPSEDYTCALNNGVKALVGDWSGLLGEGVGYGAEIESFIFIGKKYILNNGNFGLCYLPNGGFIVVCECDGLGGDGLKVLSPSLELVQTLVGHYAWFCVNRH